MSDLSLSLRWNTAINQVEIDEPVLGGDGGNANLATRQLGENVLFLKDGLEKEAARLNDHAIMIDESGNVINPHPQYVLLSAFNEAVAALSKRIDDLSLEAGVGTVLGRLDLSFSGAKDYYNAQQSIDNVRYSAFENGSFGFVLSNRFNNGSIGEVVCRSDDPSLILSLYYPDGFDESLHEIRSNKAFTERSDGLGISFTLNYSRQKEQDSNFYKYSISAGFYFEIVKI